ncbi:MAG: cytochrome c family protein [Gemmatimonadales bacterium]
MMAGSGRWLVLLAVGLGACGGGGDAPAAGSGQPAPPPAAAGLTPFQVEHGIGPVTEVVELPAAVDQALADRGQAEFEVKCAACHHMGERFVGPALGDVTSRRSPAYIMNMILNPQEMVEQHPVGKELLAQYMSFMPNQGITREDARAILEYLRTQHP